jgi:hypothetical protein
VLDDGATEKATHAPTKGSASRLGRATAPSPELCFSNTPSRHPGQCAGLADPGIKGTYQQRRQLSRIETCRQPFSGTGIEGRRAMKFPRRRFLHLAANAVALPAMSRIARAQTYPSRTVTMIVPFAAGGPTDVSARIVAERMSRTLGQQITAGHR